MHSSALFLGLSALLTGAATATYSLETTYDSTNFFREFDFFDEADPTHGYVEYVDANTANKWGLAGYHNNSVYMGVDYTTTNPANGRKSVRVTSSKSWSKGLFISDIAHMPGSICGAWPAMWFFGPDWPSSGEIDIIEGVNSQSSNVITLHTSAGCSITNEGSLSTTTLKESNCNKDSAHSGCGQNTNTDGNYGTNFNKNGGGVYAMEWTSSYISVWFFPRSSIPSDISSSKPNPSGWGKPAARFNGGNSCNIEKHFKNNNLIFDTTFCGDWAGDASVWKNDATCSAKAQGKTCKEFVAANPAEFAEAYWLINSIKVYQTGGTNYTSPGNYTSHGNYTKRGFVPKPFLA